MENGFGSVLDSHPNKHERDYRQQHSILVEAQELPIQVNFTDEFKYFAVCLITAGGINLARLSQGPNGR
jgi:hypothetical protein